MNCPQCQAPLEPTETFCAKCGQKQRTTPEDLKNIREHARETAEKGRHDKAMRKGRGWILAVAIITLISTPILYFMQKSEMDKQIEQAEKTMATIDPATRDALMKKQTGMTWQEAVDHDRGMVTVTLVTNIILIVVYFGLWVWSKQNVFAAALVALIIFITVWVLSSIVDPSFIYKGILVKFLAIAGLTSAVSAGYRARRLAETAA